MLNIYRNALSGLKWSFVNTFGIYAIKFFFSIYITRLLNPSDYGIIGSIAIFISLAGVISESGFDMALIQKRNASDKHYSSVFYLKLVLAVVTYLTLFFCAPFLADFYDEPLIIDILRIQSIILILAPFGSIQRTLFQKELNFKTPARINLISSSFSGLSGVVCAYFGLGIWALVIQNLVNRVFQVIQFKFSHSWRVKPFFNVKSLKELYSYGYKISIQGITNVIFDYLYYPIIGRYFSLQELGHYTRGKRLYDLFVKQSVIGFSQVIFPTFSKIDNNNQRSRVYQKSIGSILMLSYPVVAILISTAETMVEVLLTNKWILLVPYIKLFYLEGLFYPILQLNLSVLCSINKLKLFLSIDFIKKIALLLNIILAFKWSIEGLIIGTVIITALISFVSTILLFKHFKISFLVITKKLWIIVLCSILLYYLNTVMLRLPLKTIYILSCQIFLSLLVYFVFLKYFNKELYRSIFESLKKN